jgi:hypothetical protein
MPKIIDPEFRAYLQAQIAKGGQIGASAQSELLKYSEDQARDDNGRFASGGGGGSSGGSKDGGNVSDEGRGGDGARVRAACLEAEAKTKGGSTAAYAALKDGVKETLSDYIYRGKQYGEEDPKGPDNPGRWGASIQAVTSGSGAGTDWLNITQRDNAEDNVGDKGVVSDMIDTLKESGYGSFTDIIPNNSGTSFSMKFNDAMNTDRYATHS